MGSQDTKPKVMSTHIPHGKDLGDNVIRKKDTKIIPIAAEIWVIMIYKFPKGMKVGVRLIA